MDVVAPGQMIKYLGASELDQLYIDPKDEPLIENHGQSP